MVECLWTGCHRQRPREQCMSESVTMIWTEHAVADIAMNACDVADSRPWQCTECECEDIEWTWCSRRLCPWMLMWTVLKIWPDYQACVAKVKNTWYRMTCCLSDIVSMMNVCMYAALCPWLLCICYTKHMEWRPVADIVCMMNIYMDRMFKTLCPWQQPRLLFAVCRRCGARTVLVVYGKNVTWSNRNSIHLVLI
jgi:hypothetical protein